MTAPAHQIAGRFKDATECRGADGAEQYVISCDCGALIGAQRHEAPGGDYRALAEQRHAEHARTAECRR